MKYTKPAIPVVQQIKTLRERGLQIENDETAAHILSAISYYRLRAYTYPFQDNSDKNHLFIKKVSIEDIITLYQFDSKLRQLVFNALEHIEVALRTQIIYHFSLAHGSHWQMEPLIYRDTALFAKHLQTLNEEIERSNETFIKHYSEKYTSPAQPPAWMSIEVASFGLLSKIFQNLSKSQPKQAVTDYFRLKKVADLENWMLCLSNLRNICAHHGRLWNRRFTAKPLLPYNTVAPFLTKNDLNNIYPNKLYAALCCLEYLLAKADPKNTFKEDLKNLMQGCPLKQEKEMGFANDWLKHPIWANT